MVCFNQHVLTGRRTPRTDHTLKKLRRGRQDLLCDFFDGLFGQNVLQKTERDTRKQQRCMDQVHVKSCRWTSRYLKESLWTDTSRIEQTLLGSDFIPQPTCFRESKIIFQKTLQYARVRSPPCSDSECTPLLCC